MENIVEEIWKDIPGYENMYQVSNLGNVKSLGNEQSRREKILKPGINGTGYYAVVLTKNRNPKTIRVHKLVAMAFLNHIPCGMKLIIDHINDNKLDNRVENLRIVTQRENVCKTQGRYLSQYKGVSWCKTYNKWFSQISINKKRKFLGYFKNEYDAHLKYQETLKTLKL